MYYLTFPLVFALMSLNVEGWLPLTRRVFVATSVVSFTTVVPFLPSEAEEEKQQQQQQQQQQQKVNDPDKKSQKEEETRRRRIAAETKQRLAAGRIGII